MNIAFCLYKYFPFGGLQRDFYSIAHKCAQRGHSVTCFTREWEGEVPEWLHLRYVPTRAVTNIAKDTQFVKHVKTLLKESDYDCVVAFNRMPGADIYYAADPCYAAQVQSRHKLYRLTRRCRRRLKWERRTFSPSAPTHMLLLTELQKEEFQRTYGTPEERCHVLPPVLNKSRVQQAYDAHSRGRIREEFGVSENQFLLLAVASAFDVKGVDRTLNALAALPTEVKERITYIVAGEGHIAKYKKLARRRRVSHLCHFAGGREDVPEFYAAADIFVHPARVENSGVALLEAVAAGLPTITTDVCGYAPYIREAHAGIVLPAPFQQEKFNQTLTDLVDAPEKIAHFAANGRELGKKEKLYRGHERAVDLIEWCAANSKRT